MSSPHPSSSLSSSHSSTHSTITPSTTTIASTTAETVTPSGYSGPLSGIGNGFGNSTHNTDGATQRNSGFPAQTVFYFIAVFAFIIAITYTIHLIRRDRTKRQAGEQDEEGGRSGRSRGHTSTYRPETDEVCPPQYRAVDPDATTIVFPDRAYHSIYSVDSNDTSSGRPPLATTATTIITLRSEPLPATGETIEMDISEAGPVINAPSPVLSLANHRQPHFIRVLSPVSVASSTPTRNVSGAPSTSASTPSSSSSPPAHSRPTSPSTEAVSQLDRFRRTIPSLNRLRSEGPPPYIPPAPEQSMPQLPPEYNAVSSPTTA